MSSDAPAAAGAPVPCRNQAGRRPCPRRASAPADQRWLVLIVAVVVLDIVAFFLVPPFPAGEPGQPVSGIGDLITANLELPAPHVHLGPRPGRAVDPDAIVIFHPSITSTIFTTWLVIVVDPRCWPSSPTRGMRLIPRRLQNGFEFIYESLENFAVSLGGPGARPHVPLFAGVLPVHPVLQLERPAAVLRPASSSCVRPTSDVNVTIGLALVAFLYFEAQGFRRPRRPRLPRQVLLAQRVQERHRPAALIDLYVGLIEFFLEFVKPITLAMRLFGNIFGGELALGVITALTIALHPDRACSASSCSSTSCRR